MLDLVAAVEGHARSDPTAPAVADLDRLLSAADLAAQVRATAAGLAERGVGAGDRVTLFTGNSVDFVVAALACLWVGAVFVALPVDDPPARREALLADCRPALVAGAGGVPVADLRSTGVPPAPAGDPDRVAYAIYTSGTTGTPKGVLVTVGAFCTSVGAALDHMALSHADRVLCVAPVHFDGSYATVFPAVAAGALLLVPDRETLLFPRRFFSTVERERVTVTSFTPSYLRLLLRSGHIARLSATPLRLVGLGGEALVAADVIALMRGAPGVRVTNRYGPTETTIVVAHHDLSEEALTAEAVPIGRPNPGSDFHLLDAGGRPILAPGEVGELWISGAQLMAGYWGAPEATAAVLRDDVVPGVRAYRSGDLACFDRAGVYSCLGRVDRVVKRRGTRISLDEVAAAVAALPGVTGAACSAVTVDGAPAIAAFVTSEQVVEPDVLRAAAGDILPATMLPDLVIAVDAFPTGKSGKLDERRLLAEAGLSSAGGTHGVPSGECP